MDKSRVTNDERERISLRHRAGERYGSALDNDSTGVLRSVAIMSGKGGSGKTIIAAAMAKILARSGLDVYLIDGDVGTGGMTFYLGLKQVPNRPVGLIDLLDLDLAQPFDADQRLFQCFKDDPAIRFLGLGSHRLLLQRSQSKDIAPIIAKVVRSLLANSALCCVLVDCRSGVDDALICTTESVDDIILVVEPDTTSFQATQHLVETLSDSNLAYKIKGFIINKVFDDPTAVARNGSGAFGGQYLASVPFDIEAARAFLVGDLPSSDSLCVTHIHHALHTAYPKQVGVPQQRILTPEEFSQTSIMNPMTAIGGAIINFGILCVTAAILVRTLVYLFTSESSPSASYSYITMTFIILGALLLGLLNGSLSFRQALGSLAKLFLRLIFRPLKGW